MRRAALAIAMLGAAALCYAVDETGNDILKRCAPVERAIQHDVSPDDDGYFDAGFCIGWVSGIVDTISLLEETYEKPIFCSKNVTVGQAMSVLLKYLRENPEDLNQSAAQSAWLAFVKAWPCKGK